MLDPFWVKMVREAVAQTTQNPGPLLDFTQQDAGDGGDLGTIGAG